MLTVRLATPADIPEITEIYNEAVLKTTATFDTQPKTEAEQQTWLTEHGPKYPVVVAEMEGKIVGWASLSQWSGRCAYADTAEISLYVAESHRGNGIGKRLMAGALEAGRKAGLHSVLARIAEGNEVSVYLHESAGFELVGIMREVGRKFERLLDIHLMQKIYRADT